MLASGVLANSPNSAKASSIRCSGVRYLGKLAIIRPANDISRVSISIAEDAVNALTIGKKECVAKAGASSVIV